MLALALAALLALACGGCLTAPASRTPVSPGTRPAGVDLVVAQDGSGDFRTIQAALDAVPEGNASHKLILVRNGVYREKLFLTRSHVSLVGESRAGTHLEFAELRRSWRQSHPDDWGAAVVNIGSEVTDLVLANLTVRNDYGRLNGDHDHQFAIRSGGNATRVALLHATVAADGGDTLSLWNGTSGLSYHAACEFEGWVDFVCPRGWAYVTDSRFFGHNLSAALWHDGSKHRDQKLVVRHSRFDGVPGFPLGRNHRDGQLYLLDAWFSRHMADQPISLVSPPGSYQWGARHYYSRCRREGGDYAWFADNLATAEGAPRDEQIDAAWTFGGRWDPESTLPAVLPFAALPRPENGWRFADPDGIRLRWTRARDGGLQHVRFGRAEPPPLVAQQTGNAFETGPLEPASRYLWRVDTVTGGGLVAGPTWTFETRPFRIVLAGDSTVTDEQGWGRGFAARLGAGVTCVNLARGGRSSKSYAAEGLWQAVLRERPDYVLIQFGHNDAPGKGPERETDPATTYRENLARYVHEARAAGATPVLVTSLTRRYYGPGGRIRSDLEAYAEAAREVARASGALLIDLHALSLELLDRLGPQAGLALGTIKSDGSLDRTHLNERGSALFGALVADELRRVAPRLAPYVRAHSRPAPGGSTP